MVEIYIWIVLVYGSETCWNMHEYLFLHELFITITEKYSDRWLEACTVVEHQSLAGELFLSHARPSADG